MQTWSLLLLSASILILSFSIHRYNPSESTYNIGTISEIALIQDGAGEIWIAAQLADSSIIATNRKELMDACNKSEIWRSAFMNGEHTLLSDGDGNIMIKGSKIRIKYIEPVILEVVETPQRSLII